MVNMEMENCWTIRFSFLKRNSQNVDFSKQKVNDNRTCNNCRDKRIDG